MRLQPGYLFQNIVLRFYLQQLFLLLSYIAQVYGKPAHCGVYIDIKPFLKLRVIFLERDIDLIEHRTILSFIKFFTLEARKYIPKVPADHLAAFDTQYAFKFFVYICQVPIGIY